MNIKHIAATLAILGSASFTVTGCKKNAEGTEVPGEGEKKAESSCSAEGGCGANKEGSCSAKTEGEGAEGEGAEGAGAEGAGAEAAGEPAADPA